MSVEIETHAIPSDRVQIWFWGDAPEPLREEFDHVGYVLAYVPPTFRPALGCVNIPWPRNFRLVEDGAGALLIAIG